jgi:hypothetical protein
MDQLPGESEPGSDSPLDRAAPREQPGRSSPGKHKPLILLRFLKAQVGIR